MKTLSVSVAYMPLVDALPLIAAQELGFAEAEGIALDLIAAPSWSSVRDMLSFGRVDAAHLLSPMPVAMALGLGSVTTPLAAVSVLSVNGNIIGVSRAVEERLRANGYGFDFRDAALAADALAASIDGPLTIGVPFPFSMHVELLHYWIESTGLAKQGFEVRTVPPPLMAQALEDGTINAFCVGEPWGSVAVENGVGALLLPGNAIWSFAPEKVLAVRTNWAETEPELLTRMMRAVWQGGRWAARPESRTTAAEMLSRPEYLGVPAEVIDRALTGRFIISSRGEQRKTDGHVEFFDGAANFPWRSQAQWIGSRLAKRFDLDQKESQSTAAGIFRSDLFRAALQNTGADIPGASQKLEGAIRHPTAVASLKGGLILQPDTFFDACIFEPLDEN